MACVALFGLLWVYVVYGAMAFSGPPIWNAKRAMIERCDLGSLAIFGDSIAEAGIVPAELPVVTSNLALDAMSPIETYFIVTKITHCVGRLPRAVVLSFEAPTFTHVAVYLWENAVLGGVVSADDLTAIEQAAAALGDNSVRDRPADFGLNGWARDLVYTAHFPALYSGALIQGGLFLRYFENSRIVAEVAAARGYVPHETVQTAVGGVVRPESEKSDFEASPIQDYYFDRTLALLSRLGLPVYFVSLPLSEKVVKLTPPGFIEGFATYLHRYAEKYDNLHVIDDRAAGWPDDLFIDHLHLTKRGANLLSNGLDRCFSGMAKDSGEFVGSCDLRLKADK